MFGEMIQLTVQDTHYSLNQTQHPMRSVTEAARDRKVCALIFTGRGVEEVANAFDISIRKVAEILNEYQHDPAIRNLQGNFAAFARTKAAEVVHNRIRAAREPNVVKAPRPVATRKPSSNATPVLKVGNEDIFEALLKAMDACPSGHELSQIEYNEWRDANDPSAPGTRTIRRRMGWQNAKDQAIASRPSNGVLVAPQSPATISA
jgi:hypothetical protein